MNRTDLIVGYSPSLGPKINYPGHVDVYVFKDFVDMETFCQANPDLVDSTGEYTRKDITLFMTKRDADRQKLTLIKYKERLFNFDMGRVREAVAVERIKRELVKPISTDEVVCTENFDPWEIFDDFYGSYSGEFDRVALEVLCNMIHCMLIQKDGIDRTKYHETIAHEMFREYLCTRDLCDYGTSPRVCFMTPDFGAVAVELFEKWLAYSLQQWDDFAESLPKLELVPIASSDIKGISK